MLIGIKYMQVNYKMYLPVAATFDPSTTFLVPNTGVRTNVVSNASESACGTAAKT